MITTKLLGTYNLYLKSYTKFIKALEPYNITLKLKLDDIIIPRSLTSFSTLIILDSGYNSKVYLNVCDGQLME